MRLRAQGLEGHWDAATLSTCFSVFYSLNTFDVMEQTMLKTAHSRRKCRPAHGIPNDVLSCRVLIAFEGHTG